MKTIEELGILFSSHKYRFYNEKDLQLAIEQMFIANEIPYEREVRLSNKDIIDFTVELDVGKVGVELKIDGARNALLRQINRYLSHDSIKALYVVGTPYWVNHIPIQLNNKFIYRHRILVGVF